jgi:O-acetyl-ADP-ribose deacetylase (regulator of RNase III)
VFHTQRGGNLRPLGRRERQANSLAVVADELGAATVAFPLVSAGVYGWPVDDAVRQALTVLRAATPARVTEARPVLFDTDTYATAERVAATG